MLASVDVQRQFLFLLLILILHIRHRQQLRLWLREQQEQRFYHVHSSQVPISYEQKVFRLDTCGWNEVDFREYLR